jgi:hypothetical protein
VTDLELDKTELHLPLPKEGSPPQYPDFSSDLMIGIKTTATDPEGDVMTYNYTVSGGRIIGAGSNVFWDLNRVRPGTYSITAAVDDGCGLCGAKITKAVTVLKDPSAPECVCPEIRIDDTNMKTRGPMGRVFGVELTGPDQQGLTYNWTVSEGNIVSGQGSPKINVDPPAGQAVKRLTVTVEVSGLDANCQCPNAASRTFTY